MKKPKPNAQTPTLSECCDALRLLGNRRPKAFWATLDAAGRERVQQVALAVRPKFVQHPADCTLLGGLEERLQARSRKPNVQTPTLSEGLEEQVELLQARSLERRAVVEGQARRHEAGLCHACGMPKGQGTKRRSNIPGGEPCATCSGGTPDYDIPGPKYVPGRSLKETATELRRDISAAKTKPVFRGVAVMVQRVDKNALQMMVLAIDGTAGRDDIKAELLALASAYSDGRPASEGPDDPNPGFRATVVFAEPAAKPEKGDGNE